MSDKLPPLRSKSHAVGTSNLSWYVFVSGQMMTVGKGIIDIGAFFSVRLKITGFRCHLNQMFSTDWPQSHNDTLIAISHQHLNEDEQNNAMVNLKQRCSQKRFSHTFRSNGFFSLKNIEHHEWNCSNKTLEIPHVQLAKSD